MFNVEGNPRTRGVTIDHVLEKIKELPQVDKNGNLVWLLTHGLAVEVIQKAYGLGAPEREHHDMDVYAFVNPHIVERELVKPGRIEFINMYQVVSEEQLKFVQDTGMEVALNTPEGLQIIRCVHPALIAMSKWNIREKDRRDLLLLHQIMLSNQDESEYWNWIGEQVVQKNMNRIARISSTSYFDWEKFCTDPNQF